MVKGILFVLLALSLGAHARDTSDLANTIPKQKIILVVSVIDDIAFTDADTNSLKRYVKKVLPDHELVHVTTKSHAGYYGPVILSHELESVRESIHDQIKSKILPNYEITHLILMDHGNTNYAGGDEISTDFRFLSGITMHDVKDEFKYLFEPLVGKFSNDAFVMLESCMTVSDGPSTSQQRIKNLMNYFQIPNGTAFGAYQSMLSQGYEAGFHLGQIMDRFKSPLFISIAMAIGVTSQVTHISHINLTQFISITLGTHLIVPVIFKAIAYAQEKSKTVNWGYLFKFKDQSIDKIFNINPYENQNDLYLKLEPKVFKAQYNSCSSLFR